MAVPKRAAGWTFACLSVFSGIGLLGKAPLVAGLLHLPLQLIMAGLTVLVCLPLLWIVSLRWRTVVSVGAALLFAVTIFAGHHSMQRLHQQGRGSDQADCVVVGGQLLAHGQWPYQPAKLWTGNPMSCGPGWMALQMPATLLAGYPVNLLLLWLATLAVLLWCAGSRTTAGWLALLAVAPVCLLGLFDGTDFLTFGILSVGLLALSEQRRKLGWVKIPIVLAASLIDQFRLPTIILPVLLRDAVGRWLALGGVGLALVWQVVFLHWNAESYLTSGPWHVLRKFSSLPLLPANVLLSIGPVWAITMLVLLALLMLWLAGRLPARRIFLVFFAVTFGLPAVLDLSKKLAGPGHIAEKLGSWEGGLWLCGMLPTLAYCALVAEPIPSES